MQHGAITPQIEDLDDAPPLYHHVQVQAQHGLVPLPVLSLGFLTCMSMTPSRRHNLAPSALLHQMALHVIP